MFPVFKFIHRYSLALIILWMILYAADLIDDLRHIYKSRPSSEIALMLFFDFLRFSLVLGIWIACQYSNAEENK